MNILHTYFIAQLLVAALTIIEALVGQPMSSHTMTSPIPILPMTLTKQTMGFFGGFVYDTQGAIM